MGTKFYIMKYVPFGVKLGIIFLTIVFYFPSWIVLFVLTFFFKKVNKAINTVYFSVFELAKFGYREDYVDNSSSLTYPEAYLKQHEENKLAREKWHKRWNWFEKRFTNEESVIFKSELSENKCSKGD